MPWFAGALAAQLLVILDHPLHLMYSKANKFLNQGPEWNLEKLPSYWIDTIVRHESAQSHSYQQEVVWLLGILLDGLQTPLVS